MWRRGLVSWNVAWCFFIKCNLCYSIQCSAVVWICLRHFVLLLVQNHKNYENPMARNTAPSRAQMEMFVSMMEQRRWLATGHARTSNARQRSHQAWAEVANTLNSDGSGCVKTVEQWTKYWKDKKGAVKRKMSAIAAARRRTGGGIEDVPELSDIETRIIAIMGGEGFATGDRNLAINPFSEIEVQTDSGQAGGSSEQSQSILQSCTRLQLVPSPEQLPGEQITEDCEVQWNQSAVAVLGDDTISDIQTPAGPLQEQIVAHIHPHSSHACDEHMVSQEHGPGEAGVSRQPSPGQQNTSSPLVQRRRVSAVRRRLPYSPGGGGGPSRERRRPAATLASPQAGGSSARRRLLRRSPPSQRRSEMASLTERFIAIEERRTEAELTIARALETYSHGQQVWAASVEQLTQSLTTHAQAINSLVDVVVTRNNQ